MNSIIEKKLVNFIDRDNYFFFKKEIIRSGINIKMKNRHGDTLMHLIVRSNNISICEMIKEDFDQFNLLIDVQNNKGETPIMLSCKYGYFRFLKYIIDNYSNYNINKRDVNGMSALLIACKYGYYDIVKYLISKCSADYSINSYYGYNIPINFVNDIIRDNRNTQMIEYDRERFITCKNNIKQYVKARNNRAIIKEIPSNILNDHIEMLIELKKNCPVCFEDYIKDEIILSKCYHFICIKCYDKIIFCPICRSKQF